MTLLDALYINNSGGKALLDLLIKALFESGEDVFYLIDERCIGDYDYLADESALYLRAGIKNRRSFYHVRGNDFDKIICFGNIPPTQKLRGKVYTYFHNINLLTQPDSLSFKSKLLLKFKQTYIKFLKKNTDEWLVQSQNMCDELAKSFNVSKEMIKIYPFYKHTPFIESKREANTFFYISNGNPHKNHTTLLDAWELLYNEGINLQLSLTVTNSYPALQDRISEMRKKGFKVENKGWVNPLDLYKTHQYHIYPSLAESFGLGLVEATEAGCEVIGADLPYTFAVISPLATFNPLKAQSIANIVKQIINQTRDTQVTQVCVSNQLQELIRAIS